MNCHRDDKNPLGGSIELSLLLSSFSNPRIRGNGEAERKRQTVADTTRSNNLCIRGFKKKQERETESVCVFVCHMGFVKVKKTVFSTSNPLLPNN